MRKGLKISKNLVLPLDAVTQTFGILAVRGAGKSNAAVVMAEEMFAAGNHWVAIDPKGDWWGLRSNSDGKGAGLPIVIFGGRKGDVPLEATSGKLIADLVVDRAITCVLDVSEFTEGEKVRFLNDFADTLFRRKTAEQDPTHLFLEEADDYIPQSTKGRGGERSNLMAHLVYVFERLVKQGRARGLGATVITQRSAVVAKNVLSQVETLIALRTTSPHDRNAIADWVSYHGERADIIKTLPELQNGEAWIWSPNWLRKVERFRFRQRKTFDSGATPKMGKAKRAPATLADVNLGEIKAQMAATIERARAEDPRELRKEIVALKMELKKQPAPAAPKVKTVEVPVLKEPQIKALGKFVTRIQDACQGLTDIAKEISAGLALISKANHVEDKLLQAKGFAPKFSAAGPIYRLNTSTSVSVENGPLSGPERKLLSVLAQFESRSVKQLALLAGYAVNGGAFRNPLGALRTKGFVRQGDPVVITDAGREVLGSFDPLPRGLDLIQYWMDHLSGPEGKILKAVINAHPNAITIEELAHVTGYALNGGAFRNPLGRLRTLELVEGRGEIRASEVFFEEMVA